MENCFFCSEKDTCDECKDGFEFDTRKRKCVEIVVSEEVNCKGCLVCGTSRCLTCNPFTEFDT